MAFPHVDLDENKYLFIYNLPIELWEA